MKEKRKQKDPAFLFYPDVFLNGVAFFTHEQVGIYIRLLANQHVHGHLTEKQILQLVGVLDEEVMAKFTTDSEGKWYNVKLDDEIARRKAGAMRQRELANKRWGKDANADANADAMASEVAHADEMPALKTKTKTITKASTIVSKSPLDDLYSDLSLEEIVTTNTQTLSNHDQHAPWEPKQF
jgi:uncharacterized protein YdaU (DUF1376 family)